MRQTALKLVGLGDRLRASPRQLSGGQEQRVAIARAIVTDPDLILADEPTGNLDAASAHEVLTLLSRLNKEYGKTIVMVTHDPHAAKFATKIRYLDKGELLPEGASAGRLGGDTGGPSAAGIARAWGARFAGARLQPRCSTMDTPMAGAADLKWVTGDFALCFS